MKIVSGEKVFINIKNAISKLGSWNNELSLINKHFIGSIDSNFNKQGSIYGSGSWKPLAKPTRAGRIAKGFPGARPILEMSGKLRKSFKGKNDDKKGEVYTTSKLYEYHQNGGRRLPQRQISGYTDMDDNYITKVIDDKLNKLLASI